MATDSRPLHDKARGKALIEQRLRWCGLTKAELARTLGISAGVLSRRLGERYPDTFSEADLATIAETLLFSRDQRDALRLCYSTTGVPGQRPAVSPPPTNLPAPLTSFIGREEEQATIVGPLSSTRLLTLTGAGGCGKTRLAIDVATKLVGEHPDGVWLVELEGLRATPSHQERRIPTPISDESRRSSHSTSAAGPGSLLSNEAELIARATANAIGVREETGQALMTTLRDALRTQRVLILLDTCEHLHSGCAELAGVLLPACPGLRILVTSRQPLGAGGETVLRVAPLGLPDATDDDADLEADATRLFLDRARAASPGFSPSDADARAIVQICRQVDGIPLAIELAAARVGTISVEEIASLLRERLHLLGGGDTVRVRHRTVEGLIDWSYDLLAGAEQELFDRLSVFAGRFTAAAARSVCWEGDGDDVLDLLTLLADRSLIVSEPPNGERATRYYRLLELPRRYGWENVRVAQQGEAVRERHLAWYLRLADEASAGLRGPDQGRWIGLVEAEHDNLRAALAWALDRDAVQAALALCGALWWFWWVRGYTTEGLAWLERALAAGESSGARIDALEGACRLATVRGDLGGARRFGEECLSFAQACGNAQAAGRAMTLLGDLSRQQGQYEDSRRRYEHAVALHEAAQDQAGAAAALAGLGTVAYMQGDYASAGVLFEQSLALRRAIGEPWSVAGALSNLGLVTQQRGEYEAAERLFDEALSLRRMLGDQPGMAISLNNLGLVAQRRGDMAAARARHQESLTIKRGLGDSRGIAVSLGNLGEIATASGDLDTARHLLEESIAIKRRLGDRRGLALSLTNLADVTRLQGDNATARVLHMESVTLAMQLGDGALIASNLAGAGYVHTAQGLVASAVRLLAAATALRETIGAPAPPSQRAEQEHVLATLRTALGDASFAAAWAAGTKLLPEQAVTEALAAISAS